MTPAAAIVACNIYITASVSHSSILLGLLRRAQDRCRRLRRRQRDRDGHRDEGASSSRNGAPSGNERTAPVAMIHAYADAPYDRSSFHLAGRPDCVSDVASRLICGALNEIEFDGDPNNANGNDESGEDRRSRHPYVGLVDHVSVMPVTYPARASGESTDGHSHGEAAAKAAREIGRRMTETKLVNVHYYGMACANNTPLPVVRREKTSFFKSGDAVDVPSEEHETAPTRLPKVVFKGDTTIGTPVNFVENFNIRLTSNVSFGRAKTLTQFLRGRNIKTRGCGVVGVEALTLPYVRDPSKGGRLYEVACNLTSPKEGSADDIRSQLEKWIEKQRLELVGNANGAVDEDACKFNYEYFVEDAYRVGTTEEQCLRVLLGANVDNEDDVSSNTKFWQEYDREVFCKFEDYLRQ